MGFDMIDYARQVVMGPAFVENPMVDPGRIEERCKDDSPRSFEEMSEGPEETGLCDYCPLPEDAKGMHLYPAGHYSYEGSRCTEAYERYLEDFCDE